MEPSRTTGAVFIDLRIAWWEVVSEEPVSTVPLIEPSFPPRNALRDGSMRPWIPPDPPNQLPLALPRPRSRQHARPSMIA